MLTLLMLVLPAEAALIAASVKRLHDRNRSAWWLVAVGSVFAAFGAVDHFFSWSTNLRAISLLIAMILLAPVQLVAGWGMIEIQFLRGTYGANRFGPDPLQPEADAARANSD